VLPFTVEFSRLSPGAFVHQVLVERLHAAAVVVGENFRFGHRAAGDMTALRELGAKFGFATEAVSLVSQEGIAYSSTYVRSCVAAGDVRTAAQALGRAHRLEGIVVRGDGRGRQLGFPTANVEPMPYAAVPADGVYAGWLVRREDSWPAAISIGSNPTFSGSERRVEGYAIDAADLDLYGEHVGLDFVARLRDVKTFGGAEELVAQMGRDIEQARAILAAG
jgi:riboflavin kinase/FMN adenylyltransferase